jgi:hypothetical protein
LDIDGRVVPSEIHEATFQVAGATRTSTIHYSSKVSPYQLRRTTTIDGGPEEQRSTTLVETVALDMPHKVLGQLRTAAHLKTLRRTLQGTKVTIEVHCDDVPGGVVAHTANETDAGGHVVRRSTLELIDYAIGGHPTAADPATRRRMFHRQRPRRME